MTCNETSFTRADIHKSQVPTDSHQRCNKNGVSWGPATCALFPSQVPGCPYKMPHAASLPLPGHNDRGFAGPGKKRCVRTTPWGAWWWNPELLLGFSPGAFDSRTFAVTGSSAPTGLSGFFSFESLSTCQTGEKKKRKTSGFNLIPEIHYEEAIKNGIENESSNVFLMNGVLFFP